MRRCFAIVEYKSGKTNLEEFSLREDLPFTLQEMEDWVKKATGVIKVRCFAKPEARLKALLEEKEK